MPNSFTDFNGVEVIIYVRTTGSDITGNGTLAKPYRTFAHAMARVAITYPFYHNLYVTIDITDLGTENLPDGFILPPLYSSTISKFDYLASDALDARREGLNIVAHMTTPLDTIAGVDIVAQTFDPTSKIGTITLGAGHPLVPNALVGKFVKSTVFGGLIAVLAPISKNTASTIEIASNFFSFVSFDAPLLIVEPSAELRNNNPASDNETIRLRGWGGVMFAGIKISHANPAVQPVAIQCEGPVDLMINGCDLAGIVPGDSQGVASTVEIDNSYIHDKTLDQHFYSMEVFGCFLKNVGSGNAVGQGVLTGVATYVSNIHDNHINLSCGGTDGTPAGALTMRECIIRNQTPGFPDAITLAAVGNLILTELTCRDNSGSAIAALKPGYAKLTTVRGFNNGGPGVIANLGSHVEVTSDVDVTGVLTNTANTGITASIVAGAATNNLRVSGLAAMVPGDVGSYLKLSGAGYVIHNDTFLIVAVVNATTVDVLMNGITSPLDASNGSIIWVVQTAGVDMKAGNMPVRTWTDFRTNAPLKNEFDVPGFPSATAATATGAQIREV